jgi:hypothetical protein
VFDELYCDAELPDAALPAGSCFETKSFPEARFSRYRITKEGRLETVTLQRVDVTELP